MCCRLWLHGITKNNYRLRQRTRCRVRNSPTEGIELSTIQWLGVYGALAGLALATGELTAFISLAIKMLKPNSIFADAETMDLQW